MLFDSRYPKHNQRIVENWFISNGREIPNNLEDIVDCVDGLVLEQL